MASSENKQNKNYLYYLNNDDCQLFNPNRDNILQFKHGNFTIYIYKNGEKYTKVIQIKTKPKNPESYM